MINFYPSFAEYYAKLGFFCVGELFHARFGENDTFGECEEG